MTGFLFVDKPSGITSFDAVRHIRRLLPSKVKVGHTGTLDPLATGLLIIAVGKATRFGEYLLKLDKCYEVVGKFGFSSDTYDIDGNVKEVPTKNLNEKELLSIIKKFKGKIKQTPPSFSAVRIKGKRAYELARSGEEVSLPSRVVEIYNIDILDFSFPEFALKVCCSSGTYIRSLVHDIGIAAGTDAVVTALRRVSVDNISVEEAVPLNDLTRENIKTYLKPIQDVLPFDKLVLKDTCAVWFQNGRRFNIQFPDGKYVVVDENGEFLGVGSVKKGILFPEKVVVF
ncbi:tRNA pseudouridine(55) synthase TruB [Desulfurobacterium atlanticum]|uniref:tRNA pseudouridine synthase B n=1 Tax=Desulfurobacterium atlanticum TaxID=240169 RepID=A0A238Z5A2_9BACT|nr:tRNA pseudouridine(55) synthase TruB [Desulfurobacterium atlanticum]SNR78546.1 tRNA pseudouridine55 synthase [Desulfurobacterium atlanticum]